MYNLLREIKQCDIYTVQTFFMSVCSFPFVPFLLISDIWIYGAQLGSDVASAHDGFKCMSKALVLFVL